MNIDELMKNNPHNLTRATVSQRLKRGWSVERVMKVPPQKGAIPKRTHPYKDASYQRMAARKGWNV